MGGTNFGHEDQSSTAMLGYTACKSSVWISTTQIVCIAPTGVGADRSVGVIVDGMMGTKDGAFTFEPPTPTHTINNNSPTTGGAVVSITGNNFGLSDTTPSVVIGTTACFTASWSSFSSVSCTIPYGTAAGQLGIMNVGDNYGTITSPFTYDAPVLTRTVQPNGPTTGGTYITVVGTNFGYADVTMGDATIGATTCGTVSWSSASQIVCLANFDGYGSDFSMAVTVEGAGVNQMVGTSLLVFTYDVPVQSFVNRFNMPTTNGLSLTVTGTNFASIDATPTLTVGKTMCGTTSWTSSSSMICKASYGSAKEVDINAVLQTLEGTGRALFSFDAPAVTYHNNVYNAATTGGNTLTLSGVNFGAIGYTPSVKVGKTVCASSSWQSLTSIQCTVPNGYGTELQAGVTLGYIAGTKLKQMSYDAPIMSQVVARNMPTTSGALITIFGSNFGFEDTTPLPRIGSTRCATTSWNSETMLKCRTAQGLGASHTSSLTLSLVVGTFSDTFTYDAAAITFADRSNTPTTGGGSISISGLNFGVTDSSVTALIGVTQCPTASWRTYSSVVCSAPKGHSEESMQVQLEITGTVMSLFTYDSPVISFVSRPNTPVTGHGSITLIGSNFAVSDLSHSIKIGTSFCLTTSWTSTSFVRCHTPTGDEKQLDSILTMSTLVASAMQSFTYDSPVLTYVNRFNAAHTGGYVISITGMNFGNQDYTTSAILGYTSCATTTWVSATRVNCKTTQGSGVNHNIELILAVHVGTGAGLFSYDAPVISQVGGSGNVAASSSEAVSITGTNFGAFDQSSTISVGTTQCSSSVWNSMTSMTCQVPPGNGAFLQIVANVDMAVGTLGSCFSYNAPVISVVAAPNAPASSGASVSVLGTNFGLSDQTQSVVLGSTLCATSVWTSNTQVICHTAHATGRDLSVLLYTSSVAGTRYIGFSFDAAVVSSVNRANTPATGGTSVTVTGLNFGVPDVTPTLLLGDFACDTSSWTSVSSVSCLAGNGGGGPLAAVMVTSYDLRQVDAQMGTQALSFTYDAPLITIHRVTNAPSSTGVQISVTGLNFGEQDLTPSVLIGVSACQSTSWTSATATYCYTASGVGGRLNLEFNLQGVIGTLSTVFTYDTPIASFASMANGPMSGGASVSLYGTNFGGGDYSATIQMLSKFAEHQSCATSSWSSVSTFLCISPTGAATTPHVAVAVESVAGTSVNVFTYDAPVVTRSAMSNAPTSGGAELTVNGINFGMSDATPTIRLGSSTCQSSLWLSNTAASCLHSEGAGFNQLMAVTVDGVPGTVSYGFTYDPPTMTMADTFNIPASGGATITVEGVNFGPSDASNTVMVGFTTCKTSSWTSGTTVLCQSPVGTGAQPDIIHSTAGLFGTFSRALTFDSPVVTSSMNYNAPASGHASATVQGFNFGAMDMTPTVEVGAKPCDTSVWTSDSQVMCGVAPLGGKANAVRTNVASLSGTSPMAFTYDSPIMSHVHTPNAPACGKLAVTVSGSNFGATSGAGVRIGETACVTSIWISDTSLACDVHNGVGFARTTTTTLSEVAGTALSFFSYDQPVVTYLEAFNAPTTGFTSMTLYGTNFGLYDASNSVRVGETRCLTYAWFTDTKMQCEVAPGLQSARNAVIESTITLGTGVFAFSYNSPVVSFLANPNGPTSGGHTMTVSGTNFGRVNPSLTVYLGSTVCTDVTWSSESAVKCIQSAGAGMEQTTRTLVTSNLAHTADKAFTYDSPIVTSISHLHPLLGIEMRNYPTSHSFSVTISGSNFGSTNLQPSARFGGVSCETTSWLSDTSLICQSLGGAGQADAVVIVNSIAGTGAKLFTFDSAVVTHLGAGNGCVTSGTSITIYGTNFGSSDLSATAQFGFTACMTTKWTSSSVLTCGTSVGAGAVRHAAITVFELAGTGAAVYTYDSPVISQTSAVNIPTAGKAVLTLTGVNFGPDPVQLRKNLYADDNEMQVGAGSNICDKSRWISDTSFSCQSSPVGSGENFRLFGSVGHSVGTSLMTFTYDAPFVTQASRPNAPPSSGASITLFGVNFGEFDYTSTVSLGLSSCSTLSWTSGTALACSVQPGSGLQLNIGVAVSSITGTSDEGFTYNSPVVTLVTPQNAPTRGGGTITVSGFNFGANGANVVGQLGSTACTATSYFSETSIACSVGPGTGVAQLAGAKVSGHLGGSPSFTYDGATITHIAMLNSAAAGGAVVTINGDNFGEYNSSPTAIVAGNACTTTSWISKTTILCISGPGTGRNQHVGLLVTDNIGTIDAVFSYDAPAVNQGLEGSNGPKTGGALISITGSNFGTSNSSPDVRVGATTCMATEWVSDSQLVCRLAAGAGNKLPVAITVKASFNNEAKGTMQVGEAVQRFDYDQPLITAMVSPNAPLSAGTSVTLTGFNFGIRPADGYAIVRIGESICSSSMWFSTTSVGCQLAQGSGEGKSVSLTTFEGGDGVLPVKLTEGLLVGGFSYDAPRVDSATSPNAPNTGETLITLSGNNFGQTASGGLAAFVGVTACDKTTWLSGSSVTCVVPTGVGRAKDLRAIYDKNMGGPSAVFTFDAPVVTDLIWARSQQHAASFSLTIHGTNFGAAKIQPTVSVAEGYAASVSWISDTALVTRTIAGSGTHNVQVTVSELIGERSDIFVTETRCPNNCYEKEGHGTCAPSGQCSCGVAPNGLPYEERDCSKTYCTGEMVLTERTGTITDHTERTYWYNPWYRGESKCSWVIEPAATPAVKSIKLTFTKFDLEPNVDFVKVYEKSSLIATLSGTSQGGLPSPITTTKGTLTVTFSSEKARMRAGFSAIYETDVCPDSCNGRGKCDKATGQCICDSAWRGEACEVGHEVIGDSLDSADDVSDDWLEIRGATFSYGCGAVSGNALLFNGKQTRVLESKVLDLSEGGSLEFFMKVGAGSEGCLSNAVEPADLSARRRQGTSGDVKIEYSTDGGISWTQITSVGPSPYMTLQKVTLDLPKSPNVQLRWIQPAPIGGFAAGADSWALDEIKMQTPYVCPKNEFGVECSGRGVCYQTNQCKCEDKYYGSACQYACFVNYWHEVICGCPAPIDPYAAR
jgi:hypothetical protein